MNWAQYIKTHGLLEWPYPIKYGEETTVQSDVLILGGGIAGCWAAISAARMGLKVVILEKGATLKSGSGGSGCDHWLNTPHPGSSITAEETVQWELEMTGGYTNAISRYIAARESYDTLLELEKMGGVIRDVHDDFKGAPFRDEDTKFLFAYDYQSRIHFRVRGSTFKVSLFKECKRLGIKILDRIMATGLLTEGGKPGNRVMGATGFHCRTGEFLIFRAKAVVNGLSRHQRNWCFSTEIRGNANFRPTQIVGDGHAMSWRAGAEFTMMEKSVPTSFASPHALQPYSHGNALNTWVPCSLVDADGKEVPWVDRDGKILETISDRCMPAPGQKYLGERTPVHAHKRPEPIPDLEDRIRKGEFRLPLYADLSRMPEHERRAIWGHMVGEEGKTRIPVYVYYTEAGFDPTKDLLQSYLFLGSDPMRGSVRPQDRTGGEIGDAGGLVTDWNLMTNLEGYFAAGDALFAANYHYHAAATGRYAGRKAGQYAKKSAHPDLNRKQVERERARVYKPLLNREEIEWKELNAAACRIMQNYCGELKTDELLDLALISIKELRQYDADRVSVDNPHKLMRTLEVYNILTCDEMIIQASMARKSDAPQLGFKRLDHKSEDPSHFKKWIVLKNLEGRILSREMPLDFWEPLAENYERHG